MGSLLGEWANVHCGHYTLRGCTVQSMRPVHLVSTKVPLPSFSAHQGDPLAAMSLGRARPAPPLDTLLETTKEEAMEIDPLPEPTPHLVFGPQRFAGPETQSGLEDLFHSKLALESDMCIAQDAAHGWMTVNMPLAFVVLGVGALLWYGLRVQ
ncbi:hypothetical protein MVES1_000445 [Malassezia vespertilionis]|uniref:Uncharacterized protein n=1 Tax=Malassezia vespertilionis TaxID=2020962 RepID=A0A2N1JHH3_9BASI|nr:uncharacterized protein MVES1_000445 [Malassezia vespertilionis]PKI86000.1 hypothetical protein MVES_000412 [Malassezia vespertilionis]WFD05119.1 hypothetical protein MVES1_000445 [Malassezia vespertilionis]